MTRQAAFVATISVLMAVVWLSPGLAEAGCGDWEVDDLRLDVSPQKQCLNVDVSACGGLPVEMYLYNGCDHPLEVGSETRWMCDEQDCDKVCEQRDCDAYLTVPGG